MVLAGATIRCLASTAKLAPQDQRRQERQRLGLVRLDLERVLAHPQQFRHRNAAVAQIELRVRRRGSQIHGRAVDPQAAHELRLDRQFGRRRQIRNRQRWPIDAH